MPLWNDRPEAWHEVMPGVKRRILAHGKEMTFVLYEIAPNTRFPKHTHPHVQSGTFLQGGGRFEVGQETWKMRPGSSYLIPSNVPHELVTEGDAVSIVMDVFAPAREDFASEVVPPER
jgi:quercetin dioxygenase-like cupin family protein